MRDITYDNAKGIGLILVILGHLLPFGNLQSSLIYSVHMPLFFLISGMFMHNNSGGYKRLVFNYIYPYIFFQFLIGGSIFLIKVLLSNQDLARLASRTLHEILMCSGSGFTCMDHLWFLVSLTFSMIGVKLILTDAIKFRNKMIWNMAIIIFLSLIATLLDKYSIRLPFRFQTVPAIIVLLIIGNQYKDYINMFTATCSKYCFVILLISFIAFSLVNRTVNMSLGIYNNYLLYLLTAFFGCSVIIYISRRIRLSILSYIGRNTLILFAIHGIWIELYKKQMNHIGISMQDSHCLYCYVGTIIVLLFSLISLYALRRIYFHYYSVFRNILNIEK